jgi:hypothetical protein
MSDIAHEAPVAHHEEHESTGIDNRKPDWVFLKQGSCSSSPISNYLRTRIGPVSLTYPAEIYDIPFTSVARSCSDVVVDHGLAHNALTRRLERCSHWLFATGPSARSSWAGTFSSPSSSRSTT